MPAPVSMGFAAMALHMWRVPAPNRKGLIAEFAFAAVCAIRFCRSAARARAINSMRRMRTRVARIRARTLPRRTARARP